MNSSPQNSSYSEFIWCGSATSPEDNYNENYTPNETHHLTYYPNQVRHSQFTSGGCSEAEDNCCVSGLNISSSEYYSSRTSPGGTLNNNTNVSGGSNFDWNSHIPSPESGNILQDGQIRGRPVKRRNTANKKERRRTMSINNAFAELRDCIPNVPVDTKLSKIKTLRLATSYIAYLSDVLTGDDPSRTPAAFTAEISRKLARGDDKRRKELLMAELNSANHVHNHGHNSHSNCERKSKGRTGWPQHVWALELQQ